MEDKRGQGLPISTLILIIVGVVILVILIFGVTIGWGNIKGWISSSDNVAHVVSQCRVACASDSVYNYCSEDAGMVIDGVGDLSGWSCEILAVGDYGVEKCPGLCGFDNLPGEVKDIVGIEMNVEKEIMIGGVKHSIIWLGGNKYILESEEQEVDLASNVAVDLSSPKDGVVDIYIGKSEEGGVKYVDLTEVLSVEKGEAGEFDFSDGDVSEFEGNYSWINENNSDGVFFVLRQDKSITMKYDDMLDGSGDKTWWYYITSGNNVTKYKTINEAINEKKVNPLPEGYSRIITSFERVDSYKEGVETIIEESFMRMGSLHFLVKKEGVAGYIDDFSWDDGELIDLWIELLDVTDYDSAMRECDDRVGDYKENKIFIEYLREEGLITKGQYKIFAGKGWRAWYPDLYKLKEVLAENKEKAGK